VQTEKYQAYGTPLSQAATRCGATVADLHASLFPTRLALARWMVGGDTPHVHSCTHHMARATWYDQAQDGFQAWLEGGGFHSLDPDNIGSAIQDGSPKYPWRSNAQHIDARRSDARHIDARHIDIRHGNTQHGDSGHDDAQCK
jgi:hypothetical protein